MSLCQVCIMRRIALLTLIFWFVPNNEAAWWHDRQYDLCMATAGDNDWKCEDLLNAMPSAVEAP